MQDARFDLSTPAVLITIGAHEWDYGALATVRSLGRVGVPVYATVADVRSPVARSRYLTRALEWSTSGAESDEELVAGIRRACAGIGTPAVGIAGDDEAAVLLGRHGPALSDVLILPAVPPGLPATLASKAGLARLCREVGAATPASVAPRTRQELDDFLATATYPLVVKNPEPFSRLVDPSVPATTRVATPEELGELLAGWEPGRDLLVQEFIPIEESQDWYVEAVLGPDGHRLVAFSGRKLRAYPSATGVGTLSEGLRNPRLVDQALAFVEAVGYVGVADMDWRHDRRDDTYKLLDFNPRRGAQFSLFESISGIDVVRALHLSLTGRPVPPGEQVEGRRHVVGLLDQRAYVQQRRSGRSAHGPLQVRQVHRSWWAGDDPGPALAFASGVGPARRLRQRLDALARRPAAG